MKKSKRRIGIYMPLLLILSAAAVVFRSIACYADLDYVIGHFNSHLTITVGGAITVGAIVLYFTYPMTHGKGVALRGEFSNPATYIPAGMVGVSLLFIAIEFGRKALRLFDGHLTFRELMSDPSPLWGLAIGILAVAAIFYFFLNGLISEEGNGKRGWLGMATVLLLAVYAVNLYFDKTLAINAPNKIIDETAYLMTAIFFLYETRISLGRGKWRAYVTFGLIAAHMTAYSSIPTLIVYFAKGEMISNSLYDAMLTFTLFIFIVARLLLVEELSENKICPIAEEIDALAKTYGSEPSIATEEPSRAHEDNIMVENSGNEDVPVGTVGENYTIDLDGDETKDGEEAGV